MPDKISAERRSKNMRAIRSKDTKPEQAVRRVAFQLGCRYRLHRKDLPGKPDLAFIGLRKAVFVHGCFWHQHSGCREGRPPGSNTGYWSAKLARNVQRDAKALDALRAAGWSTLVVWECETKRQEELERRLRSFLSPSG